ncbi:MAG TPA: hypothetical protein VFB84_17585 [Micromonosporaceae bacterium]|nr:hypothetical protein [Micromonosporaceae bacterium]
MGTVRLPCASASTLFYEPEGLLLSSSLVPVDEQHCLHLLTFQLSYLGAGDIMVHVSMTGGPTDPAAGDGRGRANGSATVPSSLSGAGSATLTGSGYLLTNGRRPGRSPIPSSSPRRTFTAAVLRGATSGSRPSVWLTSAAVPDTDVHYRYTVWGQPDEDELRGELTVEVSGLAPLLTAATRATVTDEPAVTTVTPVQVSQVPLPTMAS